MTRRNHLVFASGVTTVLGFGFALVAVAFPDVLAVLYRLAGPSVVSDMGPAARLGAGIYGGLMAGWGLTLMLLARKVRLGRAAGIGLLTWWVVDSASSIALGYPLNALSNTGFLLLFAPAVLGIWRRAEVVTA